MSNFFKKKYFFDNYLKKKINKINYFNNKKVIKTWSRRSTIIPDFVGFIFLIHNGNKFIPIKINERMIGHKLGEFSYTRTFKGHPVNKQNKKY